MFFDRSFVELTYCRKRLMMPVSPEGKSTKRLGKNHRAFGSGDSCAKAKRAVAPPSSLVLISFSPRN